MRFLSRFAPLLALLATSSLVHGQATWTGAASTSWDSPANWSTGAIPGPTTDVTIAPAANQPSSYIFGPVCRNLTIDASASITLATGFDLDVRASLVNNGTLTVTSASSTVIVANSWTNNGTYTPNGSDVDFTGTGSLGGSVTTTFQDVAFSAGTRSAIASFNVDGNVTVKAGATLNLAGGVVANVAGSWTSSAAGAAVTGTGLIELDGNGSLTTGINSVPNVAVLSGTRTVNTSIIASSLSMTGGTLQVQDNATLVCNGSANLTGGTLSFVSTFAGSEILDINGSATVTASAGTFASTARILCSGNWSSSGAFAPSAGNVELDGAGTRTLSGGSTFFNLRIVSGTVNATAPVTVNGTVLIDNAATLDADAAFDVNTAVVLGNGTASWDLGGLAHTVAGNWTSAGGSAVNGTIQFDGPGDIDAGGGSIGNLSITSGLRTTGSLNVTAALSLSGGELLIDDGATVAVGGNATLSGGVLGFADSSATSDILDVQGDVTLSGTSAGTFGSSSQIHCAGNWNTSAAFTPAAGIVRLDGGTTTSVGGLVPTFPSLRIASGVKTLSTGAVLSGDLRIDTGASLVSGGVIDVAGFALLGDATSSWDLGGLTHSVGTDFTSTGGSATNGVLVLDGATGALDTGTGSVDDLSITAGTRTVVNANIAGDLALSGGTLTLNPAAVVNVGGDSALTGGTLVLSSTAVLDVADDLNVTGLTAGATAASSRIEFGGDWTADATWVPANGLVEHDGAAVAALTGPSARFANLTISSGTLSASAPMTVSQNLTLQGALTSAAVATVTGDVILGASGSWNMGGLIHVVSSDWTSAGGSATNGTVQFDADADLSTGSGSVQNVRVVSGVRRVLNSTITGNLEVTGGTLRMHDNQTLLVQGNASLTGGQISWFPTVVGAQETMTVEGSVVCNVPVEFEGANSHLRCRGGWTSSASFAPLAATVHFDGAVASNVSAATLHHVDITTATRTFTSAAAISGNVTIDTGGVLDANAVIDVAGKVTLGPTGTFDMGTLTHTVAGDWVSTGGNATGTGAIEFDGTGQLNTGSASIQNARISAGTRAALSSVVADTLTMTGGTLNILNDATLTVGNDANLTGGLLSFSDGGGAPETLDVNDDVLLTAGAGAMSANSRILVAGDWSSTSAWNPTNGTVFFDSATAASIGGTAPEFHHVTIDSGTKTISAAALIGGDLTVKTGATLTAAAAIEVLGNALLESASTFNAGLLTHKIHSNWTSTGATVNNDGTLEFVGDGTFTTGASNVPHVLVSAGIRSASSSVVRLNLTMTGGALRVLDNQTLTVQGNANLTAGTLVFSAITPGNETLVVDGDVNLTATSGTTSPTTRILVHGDWSSSSAWSPADGTVQMAPTTSATIGGASPKFADLELVAGPVDLLVPATVQDDFIIQPGVLFTAQAAADVNGDVFLGDATAAFAVGAFTHTVAGSWGSAGGSATGAGAIEFDGAGSCTTGGGSLPNVRIVAGPRSFSATQISGNLEMTAGSLAVLDNATVAVAGNALLSGGTLSFVAGAAGAEVLDVNGNVTISGAVAGATSSAAELRCAGNWSSGASYAPAAGVLIMDGAGASTIGGTGLTLANLRIAAGTKTLVDAAQVQDLEVVSGTTFTANAVLTASDDVTVGNATAAFNLGGLTHVVEGDWVSAGGNGSNGTVSFSGNGVLSTGTGTLANATVTAGTRTASNSTITGNLTLSGGTLTISDDQTLTVNGDAQLLGGTLAWSSSALGVDDVLDVNGDVVALCAAGTTTAKSVLRCAGDWTGNGSFAMGAGRVELDGATPTQIQGAGPDFQPTFPALRIVNGTRGIGNNLTISAATTTVETSGALEVIGVNAAILGNPINVHGLVSIGDNGSLGLGSTASLLVSVTGTLELLGTFGAPATITGHGGGGYFLNVDGTLDALHFRIEQMGPAGISVPVGATIVQMVAGVFSHPSASPGSRMLDIRRPAPFTAHYVDFEDPLDVGTTNVHVSGGAAITFAESDGDFDGPSFEFDPLALVSWTSNPTTISSFTSAGSPGAVQLAWTSTVETDTDSWVITRATAASGPFSTIATVPATGPGAYAIADPAVVSMQKYWYKLLELKTHDELIELGADTATPWASGLPPTVLTVGPSGTYPSIQAAINAAFPGAVIFVAPGTYGPFTINGGLNGTLRIYGDPLGTVTIDTTTGPVVIQNLTLLDAVELSDLTIGSGASPNAGVHVLSCLGVVVLDELVVHGGVAMPGVRISSSTRTAVQRCTIDGTPGLQLQSGSVSVVGRGTLDEINLTGFSSARVAGPAPVPTVEPGSIYTVLAGVHANIAAPEFGALGGTVPMTLDGTPSGLYGLAYSTKLAWFDLPSPPWEMVGLLNLLSAPVLVTGVITGPTPLNLPLPPSGELFGIALPLQMVVVNPSNFHYRWSNVTSLVLGN